MNRATLKALRNEQHAARIQNVESKAFWLAGYSACLRNMLEAHQDGLLDDDWWTALRDHLALEQEFNA